MHFCYKFVYFITGKLASILSMLCSIKTAMMLMSGLTGDVLQVKMDEHASI